MWFGFERNERAAFSPNPAAGIWMGAMRRIHYGKAARSFTRPEGVVTASICRDSGLLSTQGCVRLDRASAEFFVRGNVPSDHCGIHRGAANNRPIIVLNGPATITLTVGEAFTDPRSNCDR